MGERVGVMGQTLQTFLRLRRQQNNQKRIENKIKNVSNVFPFVIHGTTCVWISPSSPGLALPEMQLAAVGLQQHLGVCSIQGLGYLVKKKKKKKKKKMKLTAQNTSGNDAQWGIEPGVLHSGVAYRKTVRHTAISLKMCSFT